MIQLRPYQQDSVAALRENFRQKKRRVLLCAPTGSGKTVTFSYLVAATLKNNSFAKVLILTNRIELLTQAGGTLAKFGIRYEPITADNKRINMQSPCFVGMIETYYRRAQKYPELLNMTLVIIDECHYAASKKLFALWPDTVFVIGATATPIAANKSDPLSNYYNDIVNPVQIMDLIEEGYLCKAVTYAARIDLSGLKTDNMGEYSDASQMDAFARRDVYAGLINKYRKYGVENGRQKKAIIFNVNIEHSKQVASEFNQVGIEAFHIDGETDYDERERIIARFKAGEFPVICNVGILNAGFDDPTVEVIIMNRATTSESLWLQCCGRGSRPSPGKEKFTIIDMGDNWLQLGLWEKSRPWEETWNKVRKKSDKEGVSPVKDCPDCGAILPMSAKACTECSFVFPVKEKEYAEEVDFVEVGNTEEMIKLSSKSNWPVLPVADLEKVREFRGFKKMWPAFVISDRAADEKQYRQELSELARLRKYKNGWVHRQPYPFTIQQA